MTDWETRTPPNGPREVERDRKAVVALADRLKVERKAFESAASGRRGT